MYANFFGLKQEPFSIAPDPRYLYMSERHREALAHLLYGLRGGGGFVLLTGEIGAGKTTVCRAFLGQIPKRCNVAYIFNPKLSVAELLRTVCEEYGIQHHQPLPAERELGGSVKPYVDALNEFLLSTHAVGQNNVLIIDEAQNLAPEVLEQLRLLTNLETNERKLLQIILIGQPELREMLARPGLEQLSQRVIARFHLPALSEAETGHYVRHRLGVAGFSAALPFDAKALKRIYQLTRGVPRRINLLCDRALLGAYAQDQRSVDRATVDRAASEVFDQQDPWPSPLSAGRKKLGWALGGAGLLAGLLAIAWAGKALFLSPEASGPAQAALLSKAAPAAPATAASAVQSLAIKTMLKPPQLELADSLPSSLGLRSEAQAWQELARSWQIEGAEGEPCQAFAKQQLQCFRSGDGGLSLLRLLDRPSILTLRDDDGKPFYVVLTQLDEQYATVRLGEQSQRISLTNLSTQWRGEFALLWRAPGGYPTQGNAGPLLAWVDGQLAKAFGGTPGAGPFRLDAAMRARLAAFQRSQGLRSDGQAGPVTLMRLSRVPGPNGVVSAAEPRLLAPTAPNSAP